MRVFSLPVVVLLLLLLLATVAVTPAEAVSASGLLTSSFSVSQLISPSLYISPTTFTGSGAEPYHYLSTAAFFTPNGGMTTQDRFTPNVQSDDADSREDTPDNEIYWIIMAATVAGAVFLTFFLLICIYGYVKFRNSRTTYAVHQDSHIDDDEMQDMDALSGDRDYDV